MALLMLTGSGQCWDIWVVRTQQHPAVPRDSRVLPPSSDEGKPHPTRGGVKRAELGTSFPCSVLGTEGHVVQAGASENPRFAEESRGTPVWEGPGLGAEDKAAGWSCFSQDAICLPTSCPCASPHLEMRDSPPTACSKEQEVCEPGGRKEINPLGTFDPGTHPCKHGSVSSTQPLSLALHL